MNIHEKAFHIIHDIIGIIIRWDKKQISDKDAMNEIVDILATYSENDEVDDSKVLLENVEVIDQTNSLKKEKKKPNLLQKKLVAPLAISAIFVVILFTVNPFVAFTNTDSSLPPEDKKIGFEQLEEILPDDEKIQNNTTIEEFSDLSNFNKG